MPYITQLQRDALSPVFGGEWHVSEVPTTETPGELAFVLSQVITAYLQRTGIINFETLSSVVGVFECVLADFKARFLLPYERKKRAENGDVYPADLLSCVSSSDVAKPTA